MISRPPAPRLCHSRLPSLPLSAIIGPRRPAPWTEQAPTLPVTPGPMPIIRFALRLRLLLPPGEGTVGAAAPAGTGCGLPSRLGAGAAPLDPHPAGGGEPHPGFGGRGAGESGVGHPPHHGWPSGTGLELPGGGQRDGDLRPGLHRLRCLPLPAGAWSGLPPHRRRQRRGMPQPHHHHPPLCRDLHPGGERAGDPGSQRLHAVRLGTAGPTHRSRWLWGGGRPGIRPCWVRWIQRGAASPPGRGHGPTHRGGHRGRRDLRPGVGPGGTGRRDGGRRPDLRRLRCLPAPGGAGADGGPDRRRLRGGVQLPADAGASGERHLPHRGERGGGGRRGVLHPPHRRGAGAGGGGDVWHL